MLYVGRDGQDRFWPSLYSAYSGNTGLSRTHEGMGQRDEPAIRAFGLQMTWLGSLGQAAIEARSRELGTAAVEGLARVEGVRMWTSPDPALRAAVVSFDPAGLDPSRVVAALEAEGIVAASRGTGDRGGVRFSPHFYNSHEDVERGVAAIARYVRTGL